MSHTTVMLEPSVDPHPDVSSYAAIVAAMAADTLRSSGSLESNASAGSSSLSAPSLDTSHSTSSATSAASSLNPSPCPSILIRSHSDLTIPPPRSNTSSPSITFAPLPQTEPRKRSSSHQLGVAARSRLLRHRRMLREGIDPNSVPYPYGPGSGVAGGKGYQDSSDQGPVEVREAQAGVDAPEEAGARRHRSRAVSDPSEDALLALGKLVKGAGKTIWKSLSMKDLRSKEREAAGKAAAEAGHEEEQGKQGEAGPEEKQEQEHGPGQEQEQGPAQEERPRAGSLSEKQTPVQRGEAVHLFDDEEPRPPSAEGVWEEEIVQESWKQLLSNPPPVPPTPETKSKDDKSRRPTKTTPPDCIAELV
ncbi:hypothetical protein C8Q76DRAFT_136800 [Earliella scabrosa]|nr:hypothetical protein C8Q76DRAFT_136800 [Earliella scabrosa]